MNQKKKLSVIISATNQTNQALKDVQKDLAKMNEKLASSSSAFQKTSLNSTAFAVALGNLYSQAITKISSALPELGRAALEAAAQYEQSQVAFTTMLGSAEASTALLTELADFAQKTPFELVGIEANAKQLLAMGISTDELMPTLKSLGDVSSGLNVPMERLALNFGQVASRGKLTGMELRDFAVAGVPILDELAKTLGVSKVAVQEMVSAGEIGFDKVSQAFEDMTSEGGRFENLMEKQSNTFNGMVSNLQDAWGMFLRNEGQQFLEWGKDVVAWMIEFVENDLPNVIDAVKKFAQIYGQYFEFIYDVLENTVGVLLKPLLKTWREFFDELAFENKSFAEFMGEAWNALVSEIADLTYELGMRWWWLATLGDKIPGIEIDTEGIRQSVNNIKKIADNYKVNIDSYSSSTKELDANLTITGADGSYIEKNFESWEGGSVPRVCTIVPQNCLVHLKIKEDANFTNWEFNFKGKGGLGGAGKIATPGGLSEAGEGGTDTVDMLVSKTGGGKAGTNPSGAYGDGGGGGASIFEDGDKSELYGGYQNDGGVSSAEYIPFDFQAKVRKLLAGCGAGGAGGGWHGTDGGDGGDGKFLI